MSSHTDDEWNILNSPASPINMDVSTHELTDKAEVSARDCTTNVKSSVNDSKNKVECTCDAKPALVREDSIESIDEDYRRPRRGGRVPPPPRYPIPPSLSIYPEPRAVNSSTQLLDRVGKEDGIVDLPMPAQGHMYLTTYPFGCRDVTKWAWLLAAGIEDEYLAATPGSIAPNGTHMPSVERVRQRRDDSPVFLPGNIAIPSVHLSRALDTAVIPEATSHAVRYLIVTQNRHRPQGSKLLIAESRKAAGVLMYYEVLCGDSVLFVGATVHQCKTASAGKYRKVASLEEAVRVMDEGYVGVVC